MNNEKIKQLLEDVKSGQITVQDGVEKLRHLPFEDLGFARIDHHRHIRCGFPEVIYCPGKTTDQIVQIFDTLAQTENNVLASRAGREVYEALAATGKYGELQFEELSGSVYLIQQEPVDADSYIAIVTAGTADLPVAMEAQVTAKVMGQKTELICDAGVAGLHRLLGYVPLLQKAAVVVVVAGMEGALASVVGGLVDCPVVAVPTSIGYGASFKGISALLTMLNSCASGVSVVNIDNGFGGGYAASIINRKIIQSAEKDGNSQ